MTQASQKVIRDILTKLTSQPFVIGGVSAKNFPDAVVLPATTPSAELGIIPQDKGYQHPKWLLTLMMKAHAKKKILLCIDGIDALPFSEQAKFCGILKYKGLNGFAFPQETQIIVTAKQIDNVSPVIKDFCLLYQAE
ncbi:MAG: hypothetical protein IKT33_02210 [Clostridia bacterium]|nr:hypothetical protein [Clostridia bacterium]